MRGFHKRLRKPAQLLHKQKLKILILTCRELLKTAAYVKNQIFIAPGVYGLITVVLSTHYQLPDIKRIKTSVLICFFVQLKTTPKA